MIDAVSSIHSPSGLVWEIPIYISFTIVPTSATVKLRVSLIEKMQ